MPDQNDPVRDLVRRAYHVDDDLDLTAGLLDVVRRTEPPPIEIAVHREAHRAEPSRARSRRRRGVIPVVAAFAAAILVIVVGVSVAGRGPHRSTSPGSGSSTTAQHVPGPSVLPTSCAADWTVARSGNGFNVAGANLGCPPLALSQLWFVDVAQGNGLFAEGYATIWPLSPIGTTAATVTPPFAFTVSGWPGLANGHVYEIWYQPPGSSTNGTPHAGADAMTIYDTAHVISRPLLYPEPTSRPGSSGRPNPLVTKG